MRKIISLGLLAVISLIFSTQVFAGYPQCDGEDGSLKKQLQSLKIYGLCNAYWDNVGDDETQKAIEEKFVERSGGEFSEVPGKEQNPECPCWAGLDLDNLVGDPAYNFCFIDAPAWIDQFQLLFFGDVINIGNADGEHKFLSSLSTPVCLYVSGTTTTAPDHIPLGDSEHAACLEDIEYLMNNYFDDGNDCTVFD